jgi:4-deoxy-L-threo-5-hexosulose-uronate ketol-isomerase
MRTLQLADEVRFAGMSTEELRSTFLVDSLFKPGSIELVYVDLDRTVIGSATPLSEPLELQCPRNCAYHVSPSAVNLGS